MTKGKIFERELSINVESFQINPPKDISIKLTRKQALELCGDIINDFGFEHDELFDEYNIDYIKQDMIDGITLDEIYVDSDDIKNWIYKKFWNNYTKIYENNILSIIPIEDLKCYLNRIGYTLINKKDIE